MKTVASLILLFAFFGQAAAAPPSAKIVSVKKIWGEAPHCAFTDLAYWKDKFYCAFREGRAHVSTDGKIRVLSSSDGETWSSAAVLSLDGFDLRDAGLSVTPDNRLMLIGGASPRKNDKDLAPTGSFVSFSEDGTNWTKPQIVAEPGRWLWRADWHDGRAYGVSYSSTRPFNGTEFTALMVSDDGQKFRELAPKLLDSDFPTEATLRFADDGTLYCLQRRDGEPRFKSAMFGASRPPYKEWRWDDLGKFVGGPNFIQLPSGQWLAAGRFYEGRKPLTKIAVLDVEKPAVEPILALPSGGDTSYPGLIWHDDMLWVSYYSSHEGKANIYLAKVRIK
jgi:hypothetical protein